MPQEAFPGAKTVQVVGEFNDWDKKTGVKMKKQKNGLYKASINLDAGKEYQYRYLVDGESWENDWEADKYVDSTLGVENSVVITVE